MDIKSNPAMRIYWPIGLSKDMQGRTNQAALLEEQLTQYAHQVVSPDTRVSIGWMQKTTSLVSSNFLGMINDVHVIGDILLAEREGFDGAIIGCHWDPGLYGAREAASFPVAGPLESAVMVAKTLGRRFAVLTVHEGYVPMIERNLRTYGAESHAISRRPVRKFSMTYESFMSSLQNDDQSFLDAFTDVARACIDDGADVIIAGGQLFGPVFQKYGYFTVPGTGVPVVEVAACGLKMVETLVSLRRNVGLAKSEHPNSPFRTPCAQVLARALSDFGVGQPKEP